MEKINRLQCFTSIKSSLNLPLDVQDLYLRSLASFGIQPNMICACEDDWESLTSAPGAGRDLVDGMEISQFNTTTMRVSIFPRVGGADHGLERIAMYFQEKDMSTIRNEQSHSYGEIHHQDDLSSHPYLISGCSPVANPFQLMNRKAKD
jgi:glycyl-tRNA synthetase alpha subunit